MQVLDVREAATFTAYFAELPDGRFAVFVARPAPDGRTWQGAAVFPNALYFQAVDRYQGLATDTDVEDLVREWGDPDGDTLTNWITFVQQADHEAGLSGAAAPDDLPDLVVPPNFTRQVTEKQRLRAEREAAREAAAAAKARAAEAKAHHAAERAAAKAGQPLPLRPAQAEFVFAPPPTPKAKLKVVKDEPRYPYVPRQFPRPEDAAASEIELLPFDEYDHIVVSFSGGKDSIACVLYLLELGIEPARIELWHQCVDGRPGKDERVYDWPCTESYCEAFAKAFGLRLLFQWKERGLLGEMLKQDRPTAPSSFQTLDGKVITAGGEGAPGTRLAFPAMAADLMTRWCSAYVKIDVAKKVFTNDPRFAASKALILTGERREESGNRSRYAEATDYSSTKKRTVHQWRPILSWFERDVWEIMARFRVTPHPAYYLGWSRVSCFPCIFGDPNQWASIKELAPKLFDRLARLEDKFYIAARTVPNHPFAHDPEYNGYLRRGESLSEAAAKGEPYVTRDDAEATSMIQLAFAEHYPEELLLTDHWVLPRGAYQHSGGPT